MNMTEQQKIRLCVVSKMADTEGNAFETKNAHRGLMNALADGFELEYDDEQEGERAHIVLSVHMGENERENWAKMNRRGMMSGKLMFRPGERIAGSYVTIYGEIPVAVDTRRVLVERSADGGRLTLDYDVYMGGERTSCAVMEITWRA